MTLATLAHEAHVLLLLFALHLMRWRMERSWT